MKAVWGKCGDRGYGMRVMHTTRKFRIDRPTSLKFQISIRIRSYLLGCTAIPPHISPFCEFIFEDFRSLIKPLIH
jgi:hypothetical protein